MAKELSKTARVGRDKQRYSQEGERLVAGIVPLSASKDKVLLVESTRRGGWVLPKGGWETDEDTVEDAAKREAWEEAGLIVSIIGDLGYINDHRKPSEMTVHAPKAKFQFFEATVDEEKNEWPEQAKRSRKWMTYQEAKESLKDRPELIEALERSSVQK